MATQKANLLRVQYECVLRHFVLRLREANLCDAMTSLNPALYVEGW